MNTRTFEQQLNLNHNHNNLLTSRLGRLLLIIILLGFIIPSITQSSSRLLPLVKADFTIAPNFGNLHLPFIPNIGQVDSSVRFQVQSFGGTLFFTPDGVVLSLPTLKQPQSFQSDYLYTDRPLDDKKRDLATVLTVVRLRFVGANPTPEMIGTERQKGIVNYFVGNDPTKWYTNIPTYEGVVYKEIYPGINLHYDGTEGLLKGTYTIAPGADPNLIKWRYENAMGVNIDEMTGDLLIDFSSEEGGVHHTLIERAPVAWQRIDEKEIPVTIQYVIADDENIGFVLSDYNPDYPLTIDPALDYSSYLGGSDPDFGTAVAVDRTGRVYVAGYVDRTSPSLPIFDFPYDYWPEDEGRSFGYAGFVAKLGADINSFEYITIVSGNFGRGEVVEDIEVDDMGNVYVVGTTSSPVFPLKNPLQDKLESGDSRCDNRDNVCWDAFIVKLNHKGDAFVYSTYLGGNRADYGYGIDVDDLGNAYVTGGTHSTDFPLKNPLQNYMNGLGDAFVAKISWDEATSTLGLSYSTYLGGTDRDQGLDIAIEKDLGTAFVVGNTTSSDFPLVNPLQADFGNGNCDIADPRPCPDAFVVYLDSNGDEIVNSTYLGGSGWECANTVTAKGNCAITVDDGGNAYVTGETNSVDFPTKNSLQYEIGHGFCSVDGSFLCTDAFVTKLEWIETSGKLDLEYSTYLGGTEADRGFGIAVDSMGNVYITGVTYSTDFPLKFPFLLVTDEEKGNAFISKLNHSGEALVYSTYLGGAEPDYGADIEVDGSGNVYVIGHTRSTFDFPLVDPWQDTMINEQFDVFVAQIGDRAELLPPTDLIAGKLEVTQAIQDLNNSVRLVAGRRTFVRFYVTSEGYPEDDPLNGVRWAYAQLHVQKDNSETTLAPINLGNYINVLPTYDRGIRHQAFIFELPSEYTQAGTISLTAEVNPITEWGLQIPESAFTNNITSTAPLYFEKVPPINVAVLGFSTPGESGEGSIAQAPSYYEVDQIMKWVSRYFPVSDVHYSYRKDLKLDCFRYFRELNQELYSLRLEEKATVDTRYFGIVTGKPDGYEDPDPNDLPRGETVGVAGFPLDEDGIADVIIDGVASATIRYPERYFTVGHELAHTYGRTHTPACNAKWLLPDGATDPAHVVYPYDEGKISPTVAGDKALFGFNISNGEIYDPNLADLMSTCKNRWISDFTYHGLMDFFQICLKHPQPGQCNVCLAKEKRGDEDLAACLGKLAQDKISSQSQTDHLLIMGTVDRSNRQVDLYPIFLVPNVSTVNDYASGEYALVLRDSAGLELSRYLFSPSVEPNSKRSHFTLVIPYAEEIAQLDIENSQNILTSVTAGTANPTVTLTYPNGGENISGDTVDVRWTANDPDGDPLVFKVQYSADNGQTWRTLVQNTTNDNFEIKSKNIPGASQALFRVWVSDGIHVASDVSDNPFTVPNRIPSIEIEQPADQRTIVTNETLGLVGYAYDPDTGTMDDNDLQWISSIDGHLGNGDQLSIAGLSVGDHSIIFRADDRAGAVVSDTIQVSVVNDPSQLPPLTDQLVAGPNRIRFDPASNVVSKSLYIDNQNGPNRIAWNAVSSEPWVNLNITSGTTPDDITVTFNDVGLPEGTFRTAITLTSHVIPDAALIIPVEVTIKPNIIYLPIILKSHSPGSDLVVDSFIATRNAVTITIMNVGNTSVTDAFWVDVPRDPSTVPQLNQPWDTIASHGATWGVTENIPAGGTLTLTTGDAYYFPELSSPMPWPVGATVYALVDSVNFETDYGAVRESREDNNLAGPITVMDSGTGGAASVSSQIQPASREGLPPRQ